MKRIICGRRSLIITKDISSILNHIDRGFLKELGCIYEPYRLHIEEDGKIKELVALVIFPEKKDI